VKRKKLEIAKSMHHRRSEEDPCASNDKFEQLR
jgi:hypothetical protein